MRHFQLGLWFQGDYVILLYMAELAFTFMSIYLHSFDSFHHLGRVCLAGFYFLFATQH